MSVFAVLRLAFISLGRNLTRTFLTALGIIIAVASVITMVGLVDGANGSIQGEIAKLGTNVIMIIAGSGQKGAQHQGLGTLTTLKEEDATGILQECPSVRLATPWVRTSGQLVYAGQNWSTAVIGANENFLNIRDWPIAAGENFTRRDNLGAAKVCVIGKRVAENLFGDIDPVGKTIRVKKLPFLVVGVMAEKGNTGMGEDQDDRIVAPFFTVQKRLMGITHCQMILVSAVSDEAVDAAKREIGEVLRRRHHLGDLEDDDFVQNTQADISEMATSTLRVIEIFLTCVASISLVVGGINIMNMMLVSVTERTREIGVRMAVGAKERDILAQFLVEAMTLSTLGGGFGILLGISLTHVIIQNLTTWEPVISVPAILVSVIFSAAVGIFFGLYPAWKASQLDPIDALRFE